MAKDKKSHEPEDNGSLFPTEPRYHSRVCGEKKDTTGKAICRLVGLEENGLVRWKNTKTGELVNPEIMQLINAEIIKLQIRSPRDGRRARAIVVDKNSLKHIKKDIERRKGEQGGI